MTMDYKFIRVVVDVVVKASGAYGLPIQYALKRSSYEPIRFSNNKNT